MKGSQIRNYLKEQTNNQAKGESYLSLGAGLTDNSKFNNYSSMQCGTEQETFSQEKRMKTKEKENVHSGAFMVMRKQAQREQAEESF